MSTRAIPAPSLKTIRERLSVPNEKAKILRGLMTGNINPLDFDSVKQWTDECYNMPKHDELIMCAINEIMEGYGVEAVDSENSDNSDYVGNYYRYIVASYVNVGDTYDQTILLNHRTGRFTVCSWGDFVERKGY